MSKDVKIDPNSTSLVSTEVTCSSFSLRTVRAAVCIAFCAVLGGAACGGNSKQSNTPTGSTGSVSGGVPMADPADMDPVGLPPESDSYDRPTQGDETSPQADDSGPPPIQPPGLDMSAGQQAEQVAGHLNDAAAAMDSDPSGAIHSAKAALQVDETSVQAMILLAQGNVGKGYYDLAEDILLKALDRGGEGDKKAHFLMGLIYEKTERFEKAPVSYQNALTIDPNYRPALLNLGVSRLRDKRYQDAVQIFERLSGNLNMDIPAVWSNLGSAYRGHSVDFVLTDITKRNQLILKAEQSYKRAISIDKNYAMAYYNMGLLYLDADPFPTATGELDRVERLKNAKTYFDEYRRLPSADQKLVDVTAAVAQKLIDKEELLRKKREAREAKVRAFEEKQRKREEAKKNGGGEEIDDDEGFE